MKIIPAGSPFAAGPDGISKGTFRVRMLRASNQDGDMTAVQAEFDPGVITHWHSHPLGQILIVVSGAGRAQSEGGPIETVGPGDCVWFAPEEQHWHGAVPEQGFGYISVQPVQDGTAVTWFEPVTLPEASR